MQNFVSKIISSKTTTIIGIREQCAEAGDKEFLSWMENSLNFIMNGTTVLPNGRLDVYQRSTTICSVF